MTNSITYDRLHAAAIERNSMTGDFVCKLCGSAWGSNSNAEFHRPDCLLANSGYARDLERLSLRLAHAEDRLTKLEKLCRPDK